MSNENKSGKWREFWISELPKDYANQVYCLKFPLADYNHVIEVAALHELQAALDKANAEIERERIRLAACGVIALSNTTETLDKAIQMHPDYESASARDVERAVRAEIQLREENEALKAALATKDQVIKVLRDAVIASRATLLSLNSDYENFVYEEGSEEIEEDVKHTFVIVDSALEAADALLKGEK